MKAQPIVRYTQDTNPIDCPYENVRRVITGGEGNGNVHIIRVTQGGSHYHLAYDETYYFLSGSGNLTIEEEDFKVCPGAVVAIPCGIVHSLTSDSDEALKFIIFGTPPMSIEDERAAPQKPRSTSNS